MKMLIETKERKRLIFLYLIFVGAVASAWDVSWTGQVYARNGIEAEFINGSITLVAALSEIDVIGLPDGENVNLSSSIEYRWFVKGVLTSEYSNEITLSNGSNNINGPDFYNVTCEARYCLTDNGAGDFGIQRSNWKLVGAKTVTFFDFSITNPAENTVFLKGQEVRFTSNVLPSALNHVTCQWTVESGTCVPSASNSESFTTVLSSNGAITVKLAITVSGRSAYKTRSVRAVLPEVVQIGWKGDHAMTKWPTNQPITDPVWTKALGGNVTKDEPGAYTKGGEAYAELAISAQYPLTQLTDVEVRGVGNKENFYPASASFRNWTWGDGELVLRSSPLYASVNFYDRLEVNWQYRTRRLSGAWGDWVSMNTSSHILYTVDSTPAASTLYDLGLDKACRYANGASDFASAINQGIATDIYYDPGAYHIHNLYIYSFESGECCCNSYLFSILISHITSQTPSVIYCWSSCNPEIVCLFKYKYDNNFVSFRCERPQKDDAEDNPHFWFHVEASYNNLIYDPSYGKTGWATFTEIAPEIAIHPYKAVMQKSSALPPNDDAHKHKVNWKCSH